MTVLEAFQNGERILLANGIEDTAFDCGCLFEAACGYAHAARIAHAHDVLEPEAEIQFFSYIRRRASGEPLQYILGKWTFCGRELQVGKGVLIPRPETEELAEHASRAVRENGYAVVWDLCAGSGCLGLTLALNAPDLQVVMLEKYDAALYFMNANQNMFGAQNAAIVQADVLLPPPKGLPFPDMIVSNPPYVPAGEIDSLQSEVLCEPRTALDGGADGLDFYRAIKELWLPCVRTGGRLWFECGDGQGEAIALLFSDCARSRVHYDANHVDRFVEIHV